MTKEMSQLSIKRIGIPCSYGEDTQNWHTNTARNWERKTVYKHSVPVEVGAIAGTLPTLLEGGITTLLSNTGLAFLFPYYTSNKMMKCCTMITKVF